MNIPKENYSFLGYLNDRSDLIKYYQSASVYMAPSLYENLPIRILEAMACGKPIIASNVSGIPEAVVDSVNGVLTKPGSVNDIGIALCKILGDADLRKKMGDNSRKLVLDNFDSRVNAKKMVDIYESLIKKEK